MSNRGYDVVVDVDSDGDLGHTDLQEDLEFHPSNFDGDQGKIAPDTAPSSGHRRGGSRSSAFGGPSSRAAGGIGPGPGSGGSSKRYLWSIGYYQQFFDVDTNEVLKRCWAAIFPLRSNFLDVLEGNPDLYGPVWIATTVVMILFLTGTMSQYLARAGDDHFPYDFRLLSGGAGLVYGYTLVVPVALWGVLRWFGSESANVLECWALYGYANIIWIPVALISWSPIQILNYVFVGIGFGVSAFFLFRNLYPVLSATDVKTSKILLIVVVALHAGLAIAIKILFFAQGSPVSKKHDDDDDDEDKHRLLKMLFRS
ncbi:hypothetical protein GTA08_BOTSDO06137 [Botryosphaeria dothidea]|uniref:Protein YIP n=1 Tax=Botryosphaeria dothidea TaxID=55169 RepID=A0A8H4IKI6_9PEZI|nr:hypothetical protein GTA08_BOTSDO10361 [Botryosphaeria dothidea]KAF4305475.1 hypothetical protein GTA08_BOTSDO06137 [Botryosphaeria dothidea]